MLSTHGLQFVFKVVLRCAAEGGVAVNVLAAVVVFVGVFGAALSRAFLWFTVWVEWFVVGDSSSKSCCLRIHDVIPFAAHSSSAVCVALTM